MRLILVSGSCYSQINEKNNFIRCLAIRFHARGYKVSIVVPSESLQLKEWKVDGIKLFGIPSIPFYCHAKTLVPIPFLMNSYVRQLLAKLKPDIIHVQDHLALSNSFIKINKAFGIPIIGTYHLQHNQPYLLNNNKKWKKINERLIWRKFAKVFNQLEVVTALTKRNAALIRSKLIPKVIIIPNGIDLDEHASFNYNEGTRIKYTLPNRPILFYEGNIEPEDKLEDIINGVAIAIKNLDFSFVVIGIGIALQPLVQLVKKLGLENNVYFFDKLTSEDILSFYRIGDCFITSSTSALQRVVIMKAMAHGMPIIAIDVVTLNDLVHDGINGYMFSNGDVEAIANYINVILSIKYIHREMSRKSLEYIQFYDFDKTVDLFEALYHKKHWVHMVLQQI